MIRTTCLSLLIASAVLVTATAIHAAPTAEQACQNGRYAAAAAYNACEQKVVGKFQRGDFDDYEKFQKALSKCRVKYTGTWAKLHKQALDTGATCDRSRFSVGFGVTQDNLTGLQWEQKTDNASIHDKDNRYTWGINTVANGPAFTVFLANLNSGGCYLGTCDWRLPTRAELQTILSEPYPCTTSPCIEGAVGLTVADIYWSGSILSEGAAWDVSFDNGRVNYGLLEASSLSVRAVRGGL